MRITHANAVTLGIKLRFTSCPALVHARFKGVCAACSAFSHVEDRWSYAGSLGCVLRPIIQCTGGNGLANPRDFQTPTAAFEEEPRHFTVMTPSLSAVLLHFHPGGGLSASNSAAAHVNESLLGRSVCRCCISSRASCSARRRTFRPLMSSPGTATMLPSGMLSRLLDSLFPLKLVQQLCWSGIVC